jgi:hypothetical protein
MENLINWEQYTNKERTELGTLEQIAGKGTTISFVKSNFLDPSKRLIVVLKRTDGSSASITASPKVSELVRSKEITVSHLAGFPVCEQLTSDGETFAQIQMPTGQGLILVGELPQVAEYKPEVFDPADLIAF